MSEGLEGVIAAETVLSEVNGDAGRLVIRGYLLEDLAGKTTYEEAVGLLFDGFFDELSPQGALDQPDFGLDQSKVIDGLASKRSGRAAGGRPLRTFPQPDLTAAIGRARAEVFAEVAHLDGDLKRRTTIEAVRALMARLPDGDDLGTALRLVAAPAVFTAAVHRARNGLSPIAPDPRLGHAADILRMIKGHSSTSSEAAALDTYLVTVCDHGLNASTFAARVVASTRAGLTSAVLAGISALKGPLHGGAPGPVIEMLDAIGQPAG